MEGTDLNDDIIEKYKKLRTNIYKSYIDAIDITVLNKTVQFFKSQKIKIRLDDEAYTNHLKEFDVSKMTRVIKYLKQTKCIKINNAFIHIDRQKIKTLFLSNSRKQSDLLIKIAKGFDSKIELKDRIWWRHEAKLCLEYDTSSIKINNLHNELTKLLNYKTFKERLNTHNFASNSNEIVNHFCRYRTTEECKKQNRSDVECKNVHFHQLLQKNTEVNLGDCSFLNACFHSSVCKYVHYEVDTSYERFPRSPIPESNMPCLKIDRPQNVLYSPQWIKCDLRYFDCEILGKFDIIMADPAWDIHMELPYGTLADDEMMNLPINKLQDEGFIFLWVTGRAMELGRECLSNWGYRRCDEIVWVKTNQLQRLIRTGRTGHWLNHGKEHCLVGVKGTPKGYNRFIDCDVIVSEVRDTSHKPDEIYGVIERLWPNSRKIELFGRQHNAMHNWLTLGNQLNGISFEDPDVVKRFKSSYPNNYNLTNLQNPGGRSLQ